MILSKYRGIIEREELDQLLLKEFEEIVVELKKIEKRLQILLYVNMELKILYKI